MSSFKFSLLTAFVFVLTITTFDALCAPIPSTIETDPPSLDYEYLVQTLTTTIEQVLTVTEIVVPDFTPLFAPTTTSSMTNPMMTTKITSLASSSSTTIPPVVVTQVATHYFTEARSTVTSMVLQMPAVTITSFVTATAAPGPVSLRHPSPTYSPVPSTSWTLPPQFTDLDCFKISKFAGGENNVAIVTGVPAQASQTSLATTTSHIPAAPTPAWNNVTDNAIQLLYPSGSINPGSIPRGGAEFYASPVDMEDAHNSTLEYSVFIDKDFDFVRGGKLPGFYGGHSGCSGGDIADKCFSSRLMWRSGGIGELYLYVEQSKQRPELCATPPLSVCDSEYGLSIGRGSFTFARGQWTHLRQTVLLNTPGKQDGAFTLDVNGVRVLSVGGIFYRDIKQVSGDSKSSPNPGATTTQANPSSAVHTTSSSVQPPSASPSPLLDGLLGGILGDSGLLVRDEDESSPLKRSDGAIVLLAPPSYVVAPKQQGAVGIPGMMQALPLLPDDADPELGSIVAASSSSPPASSTTYYSSTPPSLTLSQSILPPATVTVFLTTTAGQSPSPSTTPSPDTNLNAAVHPELEPAFGFSGIFFSTFFGGHDPSWASPRDQYMWFKDFAVAVNN